ncbi:hypothetical protein CH267_10910 [Rhodococcus sp. 06-621-2]|nr:hypothetical protein [Rhodococcus sp. 06-621-2]OZC56064.1 hypothetical protein CH267_10910 [Rhodococcus sp. 06-621-2]OZD69097.1 hypothetical protein CH263_08095 [Rhodococcus sp. 06-1059B-a]
MTRHEATSTDTGLVGAISSEFGGADITDERAVTSPHMGNYEDTEPDKDRWVTEVQLVSDWGIKPEAIRRLFGEESHGPSGIRGWTLEHVRHIEDTVIDPAAELLRSSLFVSELHDKFQGLMDVSRSITWPDSMRPSAKRAAEMLADFHNKTTGESDAAAQ